MMSRLLRLRGTRRMSAAANPQARRSILEETIGVRLSRQDLVVRCARLHPTISAGTVDTIEALTGSWSAEVDSFLEISKSQPPLVSESHPALSQTFNSPIPPTRFQSTATLSHPVPTEPAQATSVSDSQLSPAAFADLLTPVVSALESGNNKLSDQWVASTASLFGLRGPHASSMAIALVSNITHFTQRTWPLMLPSVKQSCEPSAFSQISMFSFFRFLLAGVFHRSNVDVTGLTAHEYLHHSLPRWRSVWKTVLQGYWPVSGSPEPPQDRREDLMLALVAFLLQRLPALGDFPANPKPVLPVSIPAHVQQCPQAKSLGGSFSHSLGPLADASSETRARRVLDIWSRAGLIRVSPDGLGWTGASPVAEEALFREINQRFDDMLRWMVDDTRSAVWLDSALQLSVMFARFHESTHEGPYPTTKIHSFDPLRRLPPSGHAEALVPIANAPAASWLSRAVTGRCVDGRSADGAEYKLLWRRIQRLQWPHLLQVRLLSLTFYLSNSTIRFVAVVLFQVFARQQPLLLEREVLYVLPPRSAYPVYLLLNENDEMILISASMMVRGQSNSF
jgi:hypothetical protein